MGSDWYHGINFGSYQSKGHLSPENWSLYGILNFMEHINFQNLNVLDVGTMDGLAAFIAEREGAAYVAATDLYNRKTFHLAKQALQSRVDYSPHTSVEHLIGKYGRARFDVVIMGGLLYHVLSPLRTMLIARSLLKTGGILLLETVSANRADAVLVWNLSDPIMDEYTTYLVASPRALLGMSRFTLFDTLQTASAATTKTSTYVRYSLMARAVAPLSSHYDTDLMRRAQERALRVRTDLLMDELSLAECADAPISDIKLIHSYNVASPMHTDIDVRKFRSRFDLQPSRA